VLGRLEDADGGCGGNVGKGVAGSISFLPMLDFCTLDQCSSQLAPAFKGWHFCLLFLPREK
jgi:hypothetical protein